MFVRYVGPSTTGVLLALPTNDVFVNHGADVEVPDEVGESLLEQGGDWQHIKPRKSSIPAVEANPQGDES